MDFCLKLIFILFIASTQVDKVSFDDLSAKEKKLFQRAIASGVLSKMIEPWKLGSMAVEAFS